MAEELSDYLRWVCAAAIRIRAGYVRGWTFCSPRAETLTARSASICRVRADLPEVALVLVLDADKEGFLRSETSLMQTAGRAARNQEGKVILYADKLTDSIRKILDITKERRKKQIAYNQKHGITPQTVRRGVQDSLRIYEEAERTVESIVKDAPEGDYAVLETLRQLEQEMQEAAEVLEFERAAMLRDQIFTLKKKAPDPTTSAPSRKNARRNKGQNHFRRKPIFLMRVQGWGRCRCRQHCYLRTFNHEPHEQAWRGPIARNPFFVH